MNKKDIFKEQLRYVFSDLEASAPHDGWERLEQSLNAAARAKIVRRNWYIGSAAATVAILLGSLFFLKSPQTGEQTLPVFTEDTAPQKKESSGKQDREPAAPQFAHTTDKENKTALTRDKRQLLVSQTTKSNEIPAAATTGQTEQPDGRNAIAAETPVKETPPTEEKPKEQPNQEEIDRLVREFAQAGERDIFAEQEPGESKKRPLMLALNAKGSLSASQKTVVNSPMTLRSASVEKSDDKPTDGFYSGNMGSNLSAGYDNTALLNTRSIADNVAEMEHDQPVSVGFTVSRSIIDRLSVETGLVYTYLFSRTKNTHVNFQNQETQRFHYLGIPLNFNYNFVDFGKLGLFTSLGGMIEKDIYGEFRSAGQSVSTEFNASSEGAIATKIEQKNPQISVNAGVGAFYPIYGGFNIYGKIGGSYYFDAENEYKTIYSDRKIILDLNVGVRFDF